MRKCGIRNKEGIESFRRREMKACVCGRERHGSGAKKKRGTEDFTSVPSGLSDVHN